MKEEDIRPQDVFGRYLELAQADARDYFQDKYRFRAVACPACGTKRSRPAFDKDGFAYVFCDACHSLYNSPRPAPEMIARYYQEAPSVKFWATDFYKATEDSRREKIFIPRAAYLSDLAQRYGLARGSFLDLGCGYGTLLEEVQKTGAFAQVQGVDCSPPLAAVCRGKGFQVAEKRIEDLQPGEFQASLTASFEVLEHLFEPAAFLRGALRVMNAEGLLVVTTLTCNGFDIRVLGRHSKAVQPPYHLNLLSLEGVRLLLQRCGFEILEMETPGRLDVDIVRNALAVDASLAVAPFLRDIVQSDDEGLRQAFQDFLAAHRLSSHLRVVARPLPGN
jgi:2-polyprenyl-3-methyl-5-hydroxy-6-metoxy-1,4-benzoquinol methylase